MQPTKFQNVFAGINIKSQLVAEIKRECTLSEVKSIIAEYIPSTRMFIDKCDALTVKKYKIQVTAGDCVQLYNYLKTQNTEKKKTVFDLSSLVTEADVALTLGGEVVDYHSAMVGDARKSATCSGGVLGRMDGTKAIATIFSASSKMSGTGEAKKITYSSTNALAPDAALRLTAVKYSMMSSVEASQLDNYAGGLKTLSIPEMSALVDIVNASVPEVKVDNKVSKIMTLQNTDEGLVYSVRKDIKQTYDLKAEYLAALNLISSFQMGTKHPGLARIARTAYLGVPVDKWPVDHIISLYDAGVSYNSSILMMTGDTNLLELARSTFGHRVQGLGIGSECVRSDLAPQTRWDYVYYPEPVKVTQGSDFKDTMLQAQSKLIKMFTNYAEGTIICHLSPLLFYCQEFCDLFLVKIKARDENSASVPVMFTNKPRNEESKRFLAIPDDEMKVFIPERVVWPNIQILVGEEFQQLRGEAREDYLYCKRRAGNPVDTTIDFAMYYKFHEEPMMEKLKKITTYTQVSYSMLSDARVPMIRTISSYLGVMLWCEGLPPQNFSTALGSMISVMRDSYKAIWSCQNISPHYYQIRLSRTRGVNPNVVWDDKYSAFYTQTQMDFFEEGVQVKVESIRPNNIPTPKESVEVTVGDNQYNWDG